MGASGPLEILAAVDPVALVPLALAAALGAVRFTLGVGPGRWPRGIDVVLWPAVALGVTAAAAGWYAPFHLEGGDYVYQDFPDYCGIVAAAARGAPLPLSSRSSAVGELVGWLARGVPVFDGMLRGAWCGTALVALGTVTWARVVAGRGAGLVAGVVLLAVGPLVVLSRTPTFYPLMDGVFALAAAAAAWAVVRGTWGTVLVAGAAVGACGITDARGLGWVLALGPVVALAALRGPSGTRWRPLGAGLRAATLAGVIGLAWVAGRHVQGPERCAPLEVQVWAFVSTVLDHNGYGALSARLPAASCDPARAYCWGWSDPADLVSTRACVRDTLAVLPADLGFRDPALVRARAFHLAPWVPVAAWLVLVAGIGLLRRPRRLLALALPAIPFVAGYPLAAYVEPDVRRIAPVLLPLPVFAGVATAVLIGRGRPAGPRRWGAAFVAAALGGWLLLVSGAVPGWWGPTASWRRPIAAGLEHLGLQHGVMADGGSGRPACAAALLAGPDDLGWEAVMRRTWGRAEPSDGPAR